MTELTNMCDVSVAMRHLWVIRRHKRYFLRITCNWSEQRQRWSCQSSVKSMSGQYVKKEDFTQNTKHPRVIAPNFQPDCKKFSNQASWNCVKGILIYLNYVTLEENEDRWKRRCQAYKLMFHYNSPQESCVKDGCVSRICLWWKCSEVASWTSKVSSTHSKTQYYKKRIKTGLMPEIKKELSIHDIFLSLNCNT